MHAMGSGKGFGRITPCCTILFVAFMAAGVRFHEARAEDRSIDGTGNNVAHPIWGAASDPSVSRYVQLLRTAPSDYADGLAAPAGSTRPSAREISNTIANQVGPIYNHARMSDFVWQWGQFLDHDLDLTEAHGPAEAFPIAVPVGDPHFDPFSTGTATIGLNRSVYDPSTGIVTPREQINQITSYIDASNVYGSDAARAAALRTGGGTGAKLLTSGDDLLPLNTMGLPNANAGPFADDQLYVAGDVRANEQIGLTAMHTLFVREHNRLVDELAAAHPSWTDEQFYQRARKIVGAQMQVITYNEFLPALMGPWAPGLTQNYDPDLNATIANEFSTAMYRLGHTMLSSTLARVQNDGTTAPGGHLSLADAFFNPTQLSDSADLEYLLKGLASQPAQEMDNRIVDAVRNFLFGPPGAGGLDLASLNIQRGRDHGLADYNAIRQAYGLSAVTDFDEITSNPLLAAELASLYGTVDDIDPWVGALAEDHMADGNLGALLTAVLTDQFMRLRDGDRFWYANDPAFSPDDLAMLEATRLSDIILRNTGITNLQANVFQVPEPSTLVLLVLGTALSLAAARRRNGAAGEVTTP